MSCLKSKYGNNNRGYTEGWKYTHPSKKHYRPHNYMINKNIQRFDNDGINIYMLLDNDQEIDIETGINKDRWNFSDFDYNDEMKDGNK